MDPATLAGDALVDAHKDLTKKLRIVSIAVPSVLVVILFSFLISIMNQVRDVDTAAVAAHSAERFGELWPEIEASLGEIASSVEPAVMSALATETAALAPQLEQRLLIDMRNTSEDVEANFSKTVEHEIAQLEQRQRQVLLAEFPELAKDPTAQDRILGATRQTLVKWSSDLFHSSLDDHLTALSTIHSTLKASYTAPKGHPAEPEDALLIWLELLDHRIGGESLLTSSKVKGKGRRASADQPEAK